MPTHRHQPDSHLLPLWGPHLPGLAGELVRAVRTGGRVSTQVPDLEQGDWVIKKGWSKAHKVSWVGDIMVNCTDVKAKKADLKLAPEGAPRCPWCEAW